MVRIFGLFSRRRLYLWFDQRQGFNSKLSMCSHWSAPHSEKLVPPLLHCDRSKNTISRTQYSDATIHKHSTAIKDEIDSSPRHSSLLLPATHILIPITHWSCLILQRKWHRYTFSSSITAIFSYGVNIQDEDIGTYDALMRHLDSRRWNYLGWNMKRQIWLCNASGIDFVPARQYELEDLAGENGSWSANR